MGDEDRDVRARLNAFREVAAEPARPTRRFSEFFCFPEPRPFFLGFEIESVAGLLLCFSAPRERGRLMLKKVDTVGWPSLVRFWSFGVEASKQYQFTCILCIILGCLELFKSWKQYMNNMFPRDWDVTLTAGGNEFKTGILM